MGRFVGSRSPRQATVGVLALIAAIVLTAGLAGCSKSSSAGSGGNDEPVLVPGAGQQFVTGDVSHFVADDAQASQPLASPFTLEGERGAAAATIDNALVGGRRTTISWPSGTPLPISGIGGLDLGPVHVDADPGGVTWALDGATRTFVPGSYTAEASVAVGTGGIAEPRESVSFQADDQTVLTSTGGVTVHVDSHNLELTGPGKISVSGTLRVQSPDSSRNASAVTFGPGAFKVTLAPGGNTGLRINAVVQGGKVTAT